MKRFTIRLFAAMAAVLGMTVGTAGAQTIIVDNIGATGPAPTGAYIAQKFTMGSTAYDLLDITALTGAGSGASVGNTVNMRIYSDVLGTPGSSLFDVGTLTGLYATTGGTWTATSQFTLAASTTYWAVAISSGPSTNSWIAASSFATNTGTGGTFGGLATSSTGTSWSLFGGLNESIRIRGTTVAAVPEPGPMVLASALVGGLALLRRRV